MILKCVTQKQRNMFRRCGLSVEVWTQNGKSPEQYCNGYV